MLFYCSCYGWEKTKVTRCHIWRIRWMVLLFRIPAWKNVELWQMKYENTFFYIFHIRYRFFLAIEIAFFTCLPAHYFIKYPADTERNSIWRTCSDGASFKSNNSLVSYERNGTSQGQSTARGCVNITSCHHEVALSLEGHAPGFRQFSEGYPKALRFRAESLTNWNFAN